jgi:hypothetical protein
MAAILRDGEAALAGEVLVALIADFAGEGFAGVALAAGAFRGVLAAALGAAVSDFAQKPLQMPQLHGDQLQLQPHLHPSLIQKPMLVVKQRARAPMTLGMGHFCHSRSQSSGMTMELAHAPAQIE